MARIPCIKGGMVPPRNGRRETMKTKAWVLGGLVLAAATGAALVSPVLAQDTTAPAQGMGMGGGMMQDGMGDMGAGMMGGGMMGMRGPMDGFDFAAVDADKDGKVTEAELDAWRAAAATKMDANGDGKLSADELSAARLAEMTERAKTMADEMVSRLDADGDGFLTAAEMAARPGPAMAFAHLDADGDGAVTEAELQAVQDRMAEGPHGGMGRHGRHGGDHGEGRGWFRWN